MNLGLSFDVEDWFTVRNMRSHIEEQNWDSLDQRIDIGMDFILDELKKRNINATFFILGWTAKRFPDLVRRIASDGHEVATHGNNHTPIDLMDKYTFKKDLEESIKILNDITGQEVTGFRAPSFSITKKTLWAVDVIAGAGLSYDSSIYPTRHPDYGINDFEEKIQKLKNIVEVPMSTVTLFGNNVPISGGGYFRLFPYWLTKFFLKRATKQRSHIVMYFHPWEFDGNQPRVNLPFLKKFRHYVGLKKNNAKFIKLLNDFSFTRIDKLIHTAKL